MTTGLTTERLPIDEAVIERLARDLCNSYYLTVDPDRPLFDAFNKITAKTREHWRAQAELLVRSGWVKR